MESTTIILVLAIFAVVGAKNDHPNSHNNVLKDDYGYLRSCDSSLSQFEIKWTPRVLKYDKETTGSGYMIPNMDASHMKMCINVTVDGIQGPLISRCVSGGCKMLVEYLPQYAKFCPLKKGVKVSIKSFTQVFKPPIQLTPGTYHIFARFYNLPNLAPIACVAGDMTIGEEEYDYDYNDYY